MLWSDETKICLHGSDGRKWAWRRVGEHLKPRHVKSTINHDYSVMVWGCFASNRVSQLNIVDGTMDAKQYISILETSMVPSARELIGQNYVFQQDNDPKHTSKLAKTWFQKKNINVLEWPSQSPDLNPIENLWSIFKNEIHKLNLTRKSQLVDEMEKAWKLLDSELCKRLVTSMRGRLREVIANKGLWTNY